MRLDAAYPRDVICLPSVRLNLSTNRAVAFPLAFRAAARSAWVGAGFCESVRIGSPQNHFQGADSLGEREPVTADDVAKLGGEGVGSLVIQVELHDLMYMT
jgi:hypothetical protein